MMMPLNKRALAVIALVLSIAVGAVATWQLRLVPEVSKFLADVDCNNSAADCATCGGSWVGGNEVEYCHIVSDTSGSCMEGYYWDDYSNGCMALQDTTGYTPAAECENSGGSWDASSHICLHDSTGYTPEAECERSGGSYDDSTGLCDHIDYTGDHEGDSCGVDRIIVNGECILINDELAVVIEGDSCGNNMVWSNGVCVTDDTDGVYDDTNTPEGCDADGGYWSRGQCIYGGDSSNPSGSIGGTGGGGAPAECDPIYRSCLGNEVVQVYRRCNSKVVEECSAGCDPRNSNMDAECRPSVGTPTVSSSTERHLECVNRTCTMVGGDGEDQCARPIGSACGSPSSTGGTGTGTGGGGGGGGTPAPGPAAGAVNHSPIGSNDGYTAITTGIIAANSVFGWAEDPDTFTKSIDVHVIFDGVPGCTTGCTGVAVNANLARPDVNTALGISGNHGWAVVVPEKYRDAKPHTANAYGIDSSGDNTKNSFLGAKTFTAAASTVTATIPPAATTPPASGTPKPGDVDRDGDVDIFDLNIMVTQFGSIGYVAADLNGSGKVDIFDYNLLVSNFGK